MQSLGTLLVCTVQLTASVRIGAVWDGGPTIGVHVETYGRTTRAASWPIWNPDWDVPLIEVTRESFERFVVGRLADAGVVEQLVEAAACG